MGNILGPQRHAIHHGSARAPHPEHDSRDVYSESGRPPFLAQAVQQPGGVMPATLEEQILGEPDTRGPMATSRGTAEVRPEPVPIPIPARDAIAPVQPATQVEHPALARSENAETLNARALEAIGRFKEIEDLQHSSREYLGRLEQRIKDLRGVQQRIDSEFKRYESQSRPETLYEEEMPFTEPTRQTQPEEFRSSAMMHVQQREPAPRRSYESASTSTSGSSTSTAASTSVTDFHQVYVKGQPQAQEGRREERGGWDPARRAAELEQEAMEREGRRRRHKQHYYQESSGGGHARHGHGERKLKKRGGNPILRMLALDY